MNAFALAHALIRPVTPVLAVLNQHVDEACHRLRRRQASDGSRQVKFAQRLREDEVLFAHLQGLSVAGVEADRTASERCQRPSTANQIVRAWTGFVARGLDRDSLLQSLHRCDGNLAELHAVCEALRWWPASSQDSLPASSPANSSVLELLSSTKGNVAAWALLQLCDRHRWAVPDEVLERALSSSEPAMRTAAYSYCASFGRHDRIAQVLQGISSAGSANESTLAAACAALRLGDRQFATGTLWAAAVSPAGTDQGDEVLRQKTLVDLCTALPLSQSREAWLEAQATGAPRSRLLAAAEAANDPFHLPWLIQQLDDPAAFDEALAALTWMLGEWQATVEETTGQVTPDATHAYIEARQWPSMDVRWLNGQALGKDGVFDTLLHGPLRFRHHAARHLAMVRPHTPDLDMNAPATSQLQWLYEAELNLEGETDD